MGRVLRFSDCPKFRVFFLICVLILYVGDWVVFVDKVVIEVLAVVVTDSDVVTACSLAV